MYIVKKLKALSDHFFQTLTEGHYRAEPRPFWALLKPAKKKELPETPELTVGSKMWGTSTTVGKRFLWASVYAILSMKTMLTTAVGLAGVAAGLFGLEYYRAKQASRETITEVNFAGQKVEGTRADLCRLYQAQIKIMNLTTSFKLASLESTYDTIQNIIDSVAEERKRVKIIDKGRYGARASRYEFSEPGIKLVGDDDGLMTPLRNLPANTTQLSDMSLKPSFDKAAPYDEQAIVDRLAALHEALPPHITTRIEEQLAARREMLAVKAAVEEIAPVAPPPPKGVNPALANMNS